MASKIGVMVVDDSALMRNIITKIVEANDDMEVVAKAENGAVALQKLESHAPDIMLLDLEMPEMDGIGFLEARRDRRIEVPVVILSSIAHRGAKITMEALALGASDFILKPSGSDAEELHRVGRIIVATLRAYARNRRDLLTRPKDESPAIDDYQGGRNRTIRALAVGV